MARLPEDHALLLSRVLATPIGDPDAPLSFTTRLARENAWPPDFAERIVIEYKKFLVMAVAAGHPVTPSDEVDQAWHLHMVYTRSYWDDFCGPTGVLGAPVHHGPTKGGRAENDKFEDWYAQTLGTYQHMFGGPPPLDIWPDAHTRFTRAPHFQRINTRENWIIPKRRLRTLAPRTAALITLPLLITGCATLSATSFNMSWIFIAFGVLFVLFIVFALINGIRNKTRSDGFNTGFFCGWFGGDLTDNNSFWNTSSHNSSDNHASGDSSSDGGSSGCSSSGCGGGCGGGGD